MTEENFPVPGGKGRRRRKESRQSPSLIPPFKICKWTAKEAWQEGGGENLGIKDYEGKDRGGFKHLKLPFEKEKPHKVAKGQGMYREKDYECGKGSKKRRKRRRK